MVPKTEERFTKDSRIRKRGEYLRIQRLGIPVHGRAFLGLVISRGDGLPSRLGITTTKKLGSAVVRNRTRRLIREAFRRRLMVLPEGMDMVVIAKKSAATICASEAFEDLASIAKKAERAVERGK